MSPQFVDFNADGNVDIVAGTFTGSPYVALGNGQGWHQPKLILDRDGERILLNQFWNYETKKWDSTKRCDPEGGAPLKNGEPVDGHATSAWAMDWEGDGDLDLLLGDYGAGYLYLRLNEGTAKEPAFARKNILVQANGKPLNVGKVSTMRLCDWNGDGKQDLLLGNMGDVYGTSTGGGVFVFANKGDGKTPVFAAPVTLVAPSPKGSSEPTRPDAGLYMDLFDHDGDGDLDLIVGGYSLWTPPAPQLSAAQREHVRELEAALEETIDRLLALNKQARDAGMALPEAERATAVAAARKKYANELKQLAQKRRALTEQLEPLTPGNKRRSFVWLYENRPTRTGTWILPGEQK